ncbi:MAG: hypothetical protein ACRDJW_12025 [Thermomicrobiales bacterium]
MATVRQLGVVVTPAEVQYEGLERVLDNIQRTGATAISPTLGVIARAKAGEGTREPPGDVSGEARLLDRPLWGERELWIQAFSPHEADPVIWADVPFSPPPVAPPELRQDVPRHIIDGARKRGLKVEIQISPYILPGAPGGQSVGSQEGTGNRTDRPMRVDGSIGDRVVAGHGCLNNPRVRALGRARMREAIKHYADVDGVFLDWVEYTTYFLEDCFVCFCDHCRAAAESIGYDWADMKRGTMALWHRLHRLMPEDMRRAQDAADWAFVVGDAAVRSDGFGELLRFKAATVNAATAELRQVMNETGAAGVGLGLNGFAPPWSRISGMDYREVSRICQETRCKLFTFHWPMITRWWCETLLAWNPGLDEIDVLRAVTTALDLPAPAAEHRQTLANYGMPRPDEPHPITPEALTRKVNQAVALAGEGAPCLAYAHSYRPVDEFERHLEAVLASNAAGCWVQRYGYLRDEKLAVMRRVWMGA